ncbi:phospholipase D, putative [Acanthamoeba castellanii str. Neff]|uniref:phospholipase D n=1 Tax=Acanthamoeba castellanii (strain ATCC 30010 / Neff) TaxID=1257118 RepID=L8GVI1_ACACF|nr:phospholipase D, putative [Acanthamoeba castellanii str. Neff]ELR16578.1 phospholipase D, putative [Acanthamoeba castellanii str. Neff]
MASGEESTTECETETEPLSPREGAPAPSSKSVSFLRASKAAASSSMLRSGVFGGTGLRLAQVKGELVSVRSLAVHSSLLDTKKDIIQKLIAIPMQHENVLSLKGLYIGENEDGLETMRLLGINEHVEGLIDADSLMRSDQDLSMFMRLQMASACVEGLKALHTKGIVHGDLHLGRLFVNVQREIFKVAEYGVHRIMDREPNAFHASPEVNSAFLACHEQDYAEPEERELDDETAASASAAPTSTERSSSATTSGAGDGCSRESDVYSFGIILLQLLFGLRIADVERQRNKGKLNESAFRSKHVDVPYAPPPELQDVKLIDEGTTRGKQELLSLALECLHIDPAQRPPLENVCNRLRNGIVRTLLVDDNVRSIWMDALHIEQKRMNSRKSIILHKAENENRIISSAINQTLGLNIPNLGKLKRPNAQIEPAAPVDTNLLPFQMDWQSLYEAFFIIHLQQPAVRDDEWPSKEKGTLSKAKRNRLPHILALLLIHELIAKWDRLEALRMTSRERKNRMQSTRKFGLLEDTSGLLLMKPELKGSVSMKQWLRFSQWFPIGPPSDTKILKNVCDIIGHKYFQPIQSAKEAEALLSENSSFGTFLFRFSSHPGDYAVSCTCPPRVGRVEKEGKVTRVHLTHDRFTRTADNKFKYRNKVYDDLEAVYKALKLEKGLQAPYQSKNNGLEYLKIALEKRVDEQTLLKPGDMSPGEIAARGRAMTRVISEQFEGEEIPKNLRKMLVKDDAWVGLDSGYEPLFLLDSKEGKLMVRDNRKKNAHRERYVTVANGFLVIYTDETKERTLRVIALEGLEVMKHKKDGKIVRLYCEAQGEWHELMAQDFRESEQWAAALRRWTLNITCRWFVDGKDTFLATYKAIKAATSSVFITDWWMVGEIYLKRNPTKVKPHHRLDMLLKRKAEEGVEVYIILWKEAVMKLGSYYTKNKLQSLHPNIYVMRHPHWKKFPVHTYSHHQKTVVLDYGTKHAQALIGGLDLCLGRWDDKTHPVVDDNHINRRYPGKDYINPEAPNPLCVEGSVTYEDPYLDMHDRDTVPRMPWHDIHCLLNGEAAMDVGHNFIQRWNSHRRAMKPKHRSDYPILTPAFNPFQIEREKDAKKAAYKALNFTNLKETWEKRKEEKEEKQKLREKERHERKEKDKEKRKERDEEKKKRREERRGMERKGSYLITKLKEKIEDHNSTSAAGAGAGAGADDTAAEKLQRKLERKKRRDEREKEKEKEKGKEKEKEKEHGEDGDGDEKKKKKKKKEKSRDQQHDGDGDAAAAAEGEAEVSTVSTTAEESVDAVGDHHHPLVSSVDSNSTRKSGEVGSGSGGGGGGGAKEEDPKKRHKIRDFLQKEKQQVKGAFADIFEYSSQDMLKKAAPHAHHSGEGQWHGPTHNAECSQSSLDIVCRCQLLRSFSEWSGGNRLEKSIQMEYINVINNAQHFIYIENQYFISGLSNSGPVNKVAEALANRIIRAVKEQQPFKVVVVLPVLPDPGPLTWPGRAVTRLHADTIWNSKTSLLSMLQQNGVSREAAGEYVSFHGLRNWGKTVTGNYLSHQIYVHSKLIIVDDKIAIIGSANINDRSMNGNKDSEIAVKITDTELKPGLMNGRPFSVGRFCHSLRVTLWKEHLGIKERHREKDKEQERDLMRTICDPVVGYDYWKAISKQNSLAFAKLFPWTPQDAIGTLEEWRERMKDWERQRDDHARQQWELAREVRAQQKKKQKEKQLKEQKEATLKDRARLARKKSINHINHDAGDDVSGGSGSGSGDGAGEVATKEKEAVAKSAFEAELSGIVGHVVDYAFLFLQYESISFSEHLTLTAVGTLPVTADMFY